MIVNNDRGKANFQLNHLVIQINSTIKKLSKDGNMYLENSGTDIRLLADDNFLHEKNIWMERG